MPRVLPAILAALTSLLTGGPVLAQVSDDFNDNDYTNGPVWSGDDALFVAVGGQLRSNSPGAANYHLSTPSTLATSAQWDFFVNLKFATSGANYADVYLMSDAADLASGVNGYLVRIGGTADRVELFRSDAGTATSLVVSPDGIVNSSSDNPFRIEVKRNASDQWTLLYDDGALGTFSTAGTATDNTYSTCSHFGIRIEQSTAMGPVNNHYFDDIVVAPIVVDVTPPSLLSAHAGSDTQVDLSFDEPIDPASVPAVSNYAITGGIGVLSASAIGSSTVRVTTSTPLQDGTSYTITVNNVADLAGNAITDGHADFIWTAPVLAQPGDVIINEIMADPTPVVGLPDAEYAEVYNTTDHAIDLTGWTITDGSTTGTLPSLQLPAGGYAILTDDANAALFTGFGTVASITTFPSLNNDGDALSLTDAGLQTIDAVTYALSWYGNSVKAQGGWSLERIDPTTPCSSAANWTASNATAGGTPGTQNSVFAIVPDTQAPALLHAFVNSATEVDLQFSETMNAQSLAAGGYVFDPPVPITLVQAVATDRVRLTLGSPLLVGTVYLVTVSGVTDCPGNVIGGSDHLQVALPEPVAQGDVVINEVLYDPIGSGSDFVEIYNRSQKVLSLADWKLANETNGVIGNATPITSSAYLLLPGQYVLVTENTANIADVYPQSHVDRFIETDLPSYNNGNGVVVLQSPAGDTLDRFAYNDDLHFALLNKTEGVSLERVDPDRPTSDPTNWHSAAQTAGFATPGFQNSEYSPTSTASGGLDIERAIFSPDNDGFEDLLTIGYHFDAAGFTGTMKVYDVAGREVRTLLDNELLSTRGAISWDGIMDSGDLARMGPYIVYLEAFDLGGDVQKFRKTVVLAHPLN